MSNTPKCLICHRQWRNSYVCATCVKDTREHLDTITTLMAHVDEKRARWTGIDYRQGPSRSADKPLPYDPRVTKVTSPIITGLRGLHDVIAEGIGWHTALAPGSTVPTVATYINTHLDWLAGQPEGEAELRFLHDSADRLHRLFDRPPERLYLGQCGTIRTDDEGDWTCDAYVYVERSKTLPPHATCPRCKTTIDVNDRRDQFQEQVKLYQATMRELTRLAPLFLEEGVSHRTLKEWTRHGLIRPVGQRREIGADARWRDTPTYRIGDLAEARKVWEDRKAEARQARRTKTA